jgi:hypothetical protein
MSQKDVDRIIQHAKVAAVYFRALIQEGIAVSDAVSLTGNYMITVQHRDEPKEPWEGL